ncbi:MAG: flagellar hook-associated protein FlgK [Lentisphaerae bacterium]|nr:flagellar hook-associated protein FlgK [Lentisphaerota bacterium]
MISLNNLLEIGATAMQASKLRMSVVSHNVANVATEGYHRQRVVLSEQPPLDPTNLSTYRYSVGTGVKVEDIVREYDLLMENRLRGETSSYNYQKQLSTVLTDAEALLTGSETSNFTVRLSEFWNAWQDLSNHPESLAFRNILLQRTEALTDQFNMMAAQIGDHRADILTGTTLGIPPASGAIADDVTAINTYALEIANLNDKIRIMAVSGNDVNDLLDQRDALVNQIAEKVNLTLTREADATYTLTVDGQTLVSGATTNAISITNDNPIALELNGAAIVPTSGAIAGWIAGAAKFDSLRADLDTLALELVAQVNALHFTGYDLNGVTGVNFFNPLTTGAADIALDAGLVNTPENIAAAATLHALGVPNVGDGAIALQIADLETTRLAALNNLSAAAYYTNMVTTLGAESQTAADLANNGDAVVTTLQNTILSNTGVNMDQEMVDMLSAQRAFQAASKLINAADEMMDVVINRLKA